VLACVLAKEAVLYRRECVSGRIIWGQIAAGTCRK